MTSKFLSRYADIAFLSFEGSEKHFSKAKEIVMKTNNKYGYIVIECDVVEEGTINRIKELENVYKVRVI